MSAERHYTKDGQQYGPISAAELKALARSLLLLGLRLSGCLDTNEEVGSGDAECIANSVEKVNRGRLLVVFQK